MGSLTIFYEKLLLALAHEQTVRKFFLKGLAVYRYVKQKLEAMSKRLEISQREQNTKDAGKT